MDREKKIAVIIKRFQDINVYLRKEIYSLGESFRYTIPQLKIIALLAQKDGQRVSDLSVGSALSESTVSGIVDRLVKQKTIIRKRSREDRRVVHLFLSDEGRDEYEKFNSMKNEFFKNSFTDICDTEINQIIEGVSLLHEKILIKKEQTGL